MIYPTVHLNGTSKKELEAQYSEAIRAIRAAIKAVEFAAPNGRDYYPQGDGVINQAIAEHEKRDESLRRVLGEMQEIYEDIIVPADEKHGSCPRCRIGSIALCECTFAPMTGAVAR